MDNAESDDSVEPQEMDDSYVVEVPDDAPLLDPLSPDREAPGRVLATPIRPASEDVSDIDEVEDDEEESGDEEESAPTAARVPSTRSADRKRGAVVENNDTSPKKVKATRMGKGKPAPTEVVPEQRTTRSQQRPGTPHPSPSTAPKVQKKKKR